MPLRVLILLFGVLLSVPAWAEQYTDATLVNFAHTLMRFGAIDVTDDALLDEYAMITDCDIYDHYYDNDFKWRAVRGFIRESIKMNITGFPARYHYDAEVQLDRYDFKNRIFRFTEKSAIQGVNTFNFNFATNGSFVSCGGRNLVYFPVTYVVVIGTPISMGGLPFGAQDADALLQRLEQSGDGNRVLYVRFNITVIQVDPLRKAGTFAGRQKYTQNDRPFERAIRLDARLNTVDFYEDSARTKLIYSYTP